MFSALRRTRVGPFAEDRADDAGIRCRNCAIGALALEVLLPVETALDDIPALAVTAEDAFRLTQGRPIVLLPRQVETLKARLSLPTGAGFASRTVLATQGARRSRSARCAPDSSIPTRVFNL